jgi:hypothetical protein
MTTDLIKPGDRVWIRFWREGVFTGYRPTLVTIQDEILGGYKIAGGGTVDDFGRNEAAGYGGWITDDDRLHMRANELRDAIHSRLDSASIDQLTRALAALEVTE